MSDANQALGTTQDAGTTELQQKVVQAAQDARQVLKSSLAGAAGVIARPYAIAEMVRQPRGQTATRSLDLETMLSAYYATMLGPRIAQYRALHALLSQRGQDCAANRFCIGPDEYLWAVPLREGKPTAASAQPVACLAEIDEMLELLQDEDAEPATAMALVLETRSLYFIIVFNYDCVWSMHIRQYWRDINGPLGAGSSLHRLDASAQPLSAAAIVAMAGSAADFSDDLPGATYLQRPGLQTFLDGTLWAGQEGSSQGLRYGDCRDPGYIVSVQETSLTGLPTAQDGAHVPYGLLAHAISFLDSAVDLGNEATQ